MVVVVIIGILSALAVPKFIQITGENQLDGDVRTIYQQLIWARTHSMKTGDTCRAVFSTTTRNGQSRVKLTISKVNTATNTLTDLDSVVAGVAVTFGLPDGISAPNGSAIPLVANLGTVGTDGFQSLSSGATVNAASTSCKNSSSSTVTWSDGIQICGGVLGTSEIGAVYLSSTRSKARAYALVFDPNKSLNFANLRYMGAWEKM